MLLLTISAVLRHEDIREAGHIENVADDFIDMDHFKFAGAAQLFICQQQDTQSGRGYILRILQIDGNSGRCFRAGEARQVQCLRDLRSPVKR